MVYRVSPRTARATEKDPVSKKPKINKGPLHQEGHLSLHPGLCQGLLICLCLSFPEHIGPPHVASTLPGLSLGARHANQRLQFQQAEAEVGGSHTGRRPGDPVSNKTKQLRSWGCSPAVE